MSELKQVWVQTKEEGEISVTATKRLVYSFEKLMLQDENGTYNVENNASPIQEADKFTTEFMNEIGESLTVRQMTFLISKMADSISKMCPGLAEERLNGIIAELKEKRNNI